MSTQASSLGVALSAIALGLVFVFLLAIALTPPNSHRTTVAIDTSTRVEGSPAKPRTNPTPPAPPPAQ